MTKMLDKALKKFEAIDQDDYEEEYQDFLKWLNKKNISLDEFNKFKDKNELPMEEIEKILNGDLKKELSEEDVKECFSKNYVLILDHFNTLLLSTDDMTITLDIIIQTYEDIDILEFLYFRQHSLNNMKLEVLEYTTDKLGQDPVIQKKFDEILLASENLIQGVQATTASGKTTGFKRTGKDIIIIMPNIMTTKSTGKEQSFYGDKPITHADFSKPGFKAITYAQMSFSKMTDAQVKEVFKNNYVILDEVQYILRTADDLSKDIVKMVQRLMIQEIKTKGLIFTSATLNHWIAGLNLSNDLYKGLKKEPHLIEYKLNKFVRVNQPPRFNGLHMVCQNTEHRMDIIRGVGLYNPDKTIFTIASLDKIYNKQVAYDINLRNEQNGCPYYWVTIDADTKAMLKKSIDEPNTQFSKTDKLSMETLDKLIKGEPLDKNIKGIMLTDIATAGLSIHHFKPDLVIICSNDPDFTAQASTRCRDKLDIEISDLLVLSGNSAVLEYKDEEALIKEITKQYKVFLENKNINEFTVKEEDEKFAWYKRGSETKVVLNIGSIMKALKTIRVRMMDEWSGYNEGELIVDTGEIERKYNLKKSYVDSGLKDRCEIDKAMKKEKIKYDKLQAIYFITNNEELIYMEEGFDYDILEVSDGVKEFIKEYRALAFTYESRDTEALLKEFKNEHWKITHAFRELFIQLTKKELSLRTRDLRKRKYFKKFITMYRNEHTPENKLIITTGDFGELYKKNHGAKYAMLKSIFKFRILSKEEKENLCIEKGKAKQNHYEIQRLLTLEEIKLGSESERMTELVYNPTTSSNQLSNTVEYEKVDVSMDELINLMDF